jgi:hypothetical protein
MSPTSPAPAIWSKWNPRNWIGVVQEQTLLLQVAATGRVMGLAARGPDVRRHGGY